MAGQIGHNAPMSDRIRDFDWPGTTLGPPKEWPPLLKTLVDLMMSSAQPMFLAWGPKLIWIYNDAFTPILGDKHPDALGRPALEVWAEAQAVLEPLFTRVFAGEPVYMEDFQIYLDRRGRIEEAHFAFSYTPARDSEGHVAALFGTCIETTSKVLAEREMATQRQRFAALFEQAPTFMAMLDGPEHRIEFANPAHIKLVGDRPILGKTVAEALPDAVAQGYLSVLDDVFRSGEPYVASGARYQVQPTPEGPAHERIVDFVYQPIRNMKGEITGIFVQGFDVTERNRAEAALHELNASLERRVAEAAAALVAKERLIKTFFDHSPEYSAVLVKDEEDKFRYEEINPATLTLYRTTRDEVVGLTIDDVLGPVRAAEVNMHLSAALRSGAPYRYERAQGAGVVEAVAVAVPIEEGERQRVVVSARDISERRRLEQQLRQAQKMEAVGQLTGGIAHDFNNLLTVVVGGLQTIERHLSDLPASPTTAKLARAIDMAMQGAKRATTLTSRLLAFSRQQALMPKYLDVNRLVSGICDLLRRTLGESISLETVLAGGLWATFTDANQLENAIINLALNARDAMPSGGKLTIETANSSLDEAYVRSLSEPVAPGQYVMIAVTDTGAGMDRLTLERAFDPFFTTKEVGKGTGLGLSQVYGFARQSSGHVKIYSEIGEGTTVKIYLPRYHGKSVEIKTEDVPSEVQSTGYECILVVEDDEALRSFTGEALREMGYRVFEAANGRIALQILGERQIELLLTDVVMPGGMTGRQLADEATKRQPKLRVLFMTGYTRNAIVHNGRLDPGIRMIGKPFSYADLARAVRGRLDDSE